jgi:hypothetical protein
MTTASTYTERSVYYTDIEELLFHGFLSRSVTFYGKRISLRSLQDKDFFYLRHIAPSDDEQFVYYMMALSIFLFNGQMLMGKTEHIPHLVAELQRLPQNVFVILTHQLTDLMDRKTRSLRGVEAYAYEELSRQQWLQYRGFLSRIGQSPYFPDMGTNSLQELWVGFNQLEDDRLSDEVHWGNAKMITSVHAPKGVKKLDSADENQRNDELERRREVQERFYLYCKGELTLEEFEDNKRRLTEKKSHVLSVDELQEEMRRWVAGEMDEHDRIVAAYKQQVLDERERRKEERRRKYEELEQLRAQDQSQDAVNRFSAYSLEDIELKSPKRKGVKRILSPQDDMDYAAERYLKQSPISPAVRANETSLYDPRNLDINEQIRERKVFLSLDEEES